MSNTSEAATCCSHYIFKLSLRNIGALWLQGVRELQETVVQHERHFPQICSLEKQCFHNMCIDIKYFYLKMEYTQETAKSKLSSEFAAK